eukprot:TRINITY_DN12027_c0_g1_i1.p1 TRINITY_DN12027_c0_g1~~TRINITY_DN12027_c0_g1_i1.p1  ORF type:complete len:316 (+),score=80.29 TRINITY_DN12027_c0_g1_i1:8-955(+)
MSSHQNRLQQSIQRETQSSLFLFYDCYLQHTAYNTTYHNHIMSNREKWNDIIHWIRHSLQVSEQTLPESEIPFDDEEAFQFYDQLMKDTIRQDQKAFQFIEGYLKPRQDFYDRENEILEAELKGVHPGLLDDDFECHDLISDFVQVMEMLQVDVLSEEGLILAYDDLLERCHVDQVERIGVSEEDIAVMVKLVDEIEGFFNELRDSDTDDLNMYRKEFVELKRDETGYLSSVNNLDKAIEQFPTTRHKDVVRLGEELEQLFRDIKPKLIEMQKYYNLPTDISEAKQVILELKQEIKDLQNQVILQIQNKNSSELN